MFAIYSIAALVGYSTLHGGGFGEIARWVVAFVGMTLLIMVFSDKNRKLFFTPARLNMVWGIFLFWCLITAFFSTSIDSSFGELLTFCGVFATGFLAYSLPQNYKDIDRMLLVIMLGALIVTAIGWHYYLLGRFTSIEGHEMIRHFIGPFFWKNPMAGYLVLFIPVAISCSVFFKGKYRIASIVLAILMIGGLVLTRSRAGWLSFGIVFLGILVPGIIRKTKITFVFMIIVIVGFGLAVGLLMEHPDSVTERIYTLQKIPMTQANRSERSTEERIIMLKAGLEVAKDYPIFGVGLRAWPAIRPTYLRDLKYLPKFPHNAYLRALAELGFPGLLILLIGLIMTYFPMFKNAYKKDSQILNLGIIAGIIGVLGHMAVDFHAAFSGILLPISVLTGLALRMHVNPEEKKSPGPWRNTVLVFGVLFTLILLARQASSLIIDESKQSFTARYIEEAESSANIASLLNPLDWEPHFLLYRIHSGRDENEVALVEARSAARLAPTVSEMRLAIARSELATGDTLNAIKSYRNAIALGHRASAESYVELSELLKKSGMIEEEKELLIDMVNALEPFADNNYTAQTAGYRYKVAIAWSRLHQIYSLTQDSLMADIAEFKAHQYSSPRANDRPMSLMGYHTITPEKTLCELFEAIAEADTERIKQLTPQGIATLPRFEKNTIIAIDKILDVQENPVTGVAKVDVRLIRTDETGQIQYSNNSINLIFAKEKWVVIFN